MRRFIERIAFGGERRLRFLSWVLDHHYRALFRRQWGDERPHFFDHRHNVWALLRGDGEPWGLYRGFNAGMFVEPTDSVLDIGCGDGFFTARFLGCRADHVDGIDSDPSAIAHARALYPGIFHLLDAVSDPFPRESYDVIVWDGALAHFSRDDAEIVLKKIVACKPRWFCGSEALHDESPDHLQVFDESGLKALIGAHFDAVEVVTKSHGGITEAYWRAQ